MITHAILTVLVAAMPLWVTVPGQEKEEDIAAKVAECVKMMNDEDWEVRGKGEQALMELGKEAIPHLRKLIEEKGDTFSRKEDIVEALEDLELDWVESVIKKLYTEEGNVGSFEGQCKPILEELGDEAERLLLALVKSPIRARMDREIAARALADLGKPSAIKGLKEVWDDEFETEGVRITVAFVMDTLGDSSAFDLVAAKAKENLEAHPEAPPAISMMITVHMHKKEYEQILSLYDRWEKIDAKNPMVYYNKACTLAKMGKKEEALTTLEKAVETGYRDYKWMEKDGDMSTLRDEERYKALVKKLKGS